MALAHAVAAVQLHGLVDDLLRLVGGEELRHRRLARHARGARILRPGGAIDEQRGGIDVERHVGEVALHHLQLGHRRAEQLSLGSAFQALVEGAAGKAERGGADRRAEHVEHRHGDLEAVARLADHGGGGDAHAVEGEPRQRMRRDDFQPLGDVEALRVGGHEEGRDALRAWRFAGAREDDIEVGDAAVGDPGLLA